MASRQAWQGGDPTEEGHGPFPPEAKETRLGDTLLKAERRTGFLAAPNSRRWPAGVLLKEITGKSFLRKGQEVYQKTISVCHGRPHPLHFQFLTFSNVPEPPCAMLWSNETRLLRKRKINELRWPGREGGRGLACSRLLRPVTLRHAVQPTARCSCTARETGEDRPMAALPQRSALFNKVNNLSVRGMRKAVLAQRLNGKRRSH